MIASLLILVLWLVGWAIFWRLPVFGDAPASTGASTVSVVIPARNEEAALPVLLRSLLPELARLHEVIVVDDSSTDRTAVVAREFGATVLASEPLPDGWRGKTWACHQGAHAASGCALLFLDADTWLEPGGLAKILAAYASGNGVLSIGPYHAVQRPYEQLCAFFNLVMHVGMGAFTVFGKALPWGLFGQMLMLERADYLRIGGHEAVKDRVLENLALARLFRAADVPLRCMNGHGLLAFRMYPNGFRQMVEGWTKGFASGAAETAPVVTLALVMWLSGMVAAGFQAALHADRLSACVYLLFAFQLYTMFRRVGAFRWYTALFYPVPLVFYFAVFALSAARRGKRVQWKGREIHAD